jgi:hypothetical protein
MHFGIPWDVGKCFSSYRAEGLLRRAQSMEPIKNSVAFSPRANYTD